jgi:hypothetical protein
MTYHARSRLHYGGTKQMENVVNSAGSHADVKKMRETRNKAQAANMGMNNTAAIVAQEELQFI